MFWRTMSQDGNICWRVGCILKRIVEMQKKAKKLMICAPMPMPRLAKAGLLRLEVDGATCKAEWLVPLHWLRWQSDDAFETKAILF